MATEQDLNKFIKSDNFQSEWLEAREGRVVKSIMRSIQQTLKPIPKNLGKDFSYEDIVRCSRANLGTGDDTFWLVDRALGNLGLNKHDFP